MDYESKILKIKPPVWGLILASVIVLFVSIFLIVLKKGKLCFSLLQLLKMLLGFHESIWIIL